MDARELQVARQRHVRELDALPCRFFPPAPVEIDLRPLDERPAAAGRVAALDAQVLAAHLAVRVLAHERQLAVEATHGPAPAGLVAEERPVLGAGAVEAEALDLGRTAPEGADVQAARQAIASERSVQVADADEAVDPDAPGLDAEAVRRRLVAQRGLVEAIAPLVLGQAFAETARAHVLPAAPAQREAERLAGDVRDADVASRRAFAVVEPGLRVVGALVVAEGDRAAHPRRRAHRRRSRRGGNGGRLRGARLHGDVWCASGLGGCRLCRHDPHQRVASLDGAGLREHAARGRVLGDERHLDFRQGGIALEQLEAVADAEAGGASSVEIDGRGRAIADAEARAVGCRLRRAALPARGDERQEKHGDQGTAHGRLRTAPRVRVPTTSSSLPLRWHW